MSVYSDSEAEDLPRDEELLSLLGGASSSSTYLPFQSANDLPNPDDPSRKKRKRALREREAEYEKKSRKGQVGSDDEGNVVKRLPIKLPSGHLQERQGTTTLPARNAPKKGGEDDSDSDKEEEDEWSAPKYQPEGAGLGTRWGRMAVADVVRIKNVKERKSVAREQIAGLGAEIVAGGELVDNVSLSVSLRSVLLPSSFES